MPASKNLDDIYLELMEHPSFRAAYADAKVEHAISDQIDAAKAAAGISYDDFPAQLGLPPDKVERIEDRIMWGDLPMESLLRRYSAALGRDLQVSLVKAQAVRHGTEPDIRLVYETSALHQEDSQSAQVGPKSRQRTEQRAQVLGLDTVLATRVKQGLTQQDMARRMGVPKAKIVRLESRLSRGIAPRGTILKRYIKALGYRMMLSLVDPKRD